MSSATDKTVTVGPFDPNSINKQSDVIGPATLTKAGVMTAEMLQELDALVAGVIPSAPVDLFVSASGSNANDGLTAGTALATFGAAWDAALKVNWTKARINVLPGAPVPMEARGYAESLRLSGGSPIIVLGSFEAQVLNPVGPVTVLTETVGDPTGTICTDASLAMTVGAFSGQAFLVCTNAAGLNKGVRLNIKSNDATSVTVQDGSGFPEPIAIGDTFEVQLPSSFLDLQPGAGVFGFGNGYIGWQGIQLNLNGGALIQTDECPFATDGLVIDGGFGAFVTRKNSLYQGCNNGPWSQDADSPFNDNSDDGTLFKNVILVYGHGNVMMGNHMLLNTLVQQGFAGGLLTPNSVIGKDSSLRIRNKSMFVCSVAELDGFFAPPFPPAFVDNDSLFNVPGFSCINAGTHPTLAVTNRSYATFAGGAGAVGNTGPGITVDDTSQLNTNGSTAPTGSTPGVNDVVVAGTSKAYGALPYLEPNTLGYAK